jgi:GT2 family glycosyltransferase
MARPVVPIMPTIGVIIAVHNRLNTTRASIDRLVKAAEYAEARVVLVVVDDGSTDGTWEYLTAEFAGSSNVLLKGDGNLYWAGAMRHAMVAAESTLENVDFILLLNDDTMLASEGITYLLGVMVEFNTSIVVGAVVDPATKAWTYGGYRRRSRWRCLSFVPVPLGSSAPCDTMNANAVLIRRDAFGRVGPFDSTFTHSLADFDYGLRASRGGETLVVTGCPVGTCGRNTEVGAWTDTALPRRLRFRLMLAPKGLPPREWSHFCVRHGGAIGVLYAVRPWLRLLRRKVSGSAGDHLDR